MRFSFGVKCVVITWMLSEREGAWDERSIEISVEKETNQGLKMERRRLPTIICSCHYIAFITFCLFIQFIASILLPIQSGIEWINTISLNANENRIYCEISACVSGVCKYYFLVSCVFVVAYNHTKHMPLDVVKAKCISNDFYCWSHFHPLPQFRFPYSFPSYFTLFLPLYLFVISTHFFNSPQLSFSINYNPISGQHAT